MLHNEITPDDAINASISFDLGGYDFEQDYFDTRPECQPAAYINSNCCSLPAHHCAFVRQKKYAAVNIWQFDVGDVHAGAHLIGAGRSDNLC